MNSPIDNINLYFVVVVSEEETLTKLCSHIATIGYSVSEPSLPHDIYRALSVPSSTFQGGFSPVDADLPSILPDILEALSPHVIDVIIALDDFSKIKICRNEYIDSMPNHSTLDEIESAHILATLEKCSWRCKTAAKFLGVDRSTIYRKMKKYGISKTKR